MDDQVEGYKVSLELIIGRFDIVKKLRESFLGEVLIELRFKQWELTHWIWERSRGYQENEMTCPKAQRLKETWRIWNTELRPKGLYPTEKGKREWGIKKQLRVTPCKIWWIISGNFVCKFAVRSNERVSSLGRGGEGDTIRLPFGENVTLTPGRGAVEQRAERSRADQ